MNIWQVLKLVRCLLSCEVPLRVGQHLIANHELLDRGRPEQWRIVDSMKLPVAVVLAVMIRTSGCTMEPHGVGEATLKQVVILGGQLLHDVS